MLPMGPSCDTGPHAEQVAVELLAAATAANHGMGLPLSIWLGWASYESGHTPTTHEALAGWLANAITRHDEENPSPPLTAQSGGGE